MAEERRSLIDHGLAYGVSHDEIHRAMFHIYGAGAFFDDDLASQVKAELLAELPDDRPELVVEPAAMDLGTVSIDGGLVTATFTVRNAGQMDLTIAGLQTSCGCTTAVLSTSQGASPVFGAGPPGDVRWSAVLAPGEKATLEATFDPMAHGPEGTGELQRTISVISDDPLNPRLEVAFDIEVV
jgi:hypothetical protein